MKAESHDDDDESEHNDEDDHFVDEDEMKEAMSVMKITMK